MVSNLRNKVLDSIVTIECTYPDGSIRKHTDTAFIIRHRFTLKQNNIRPTDIVFYIDNPDVIEYFGTVFEMSIHPFYHGKVTYIY